MECFTKLSTQKYTFEELNSPIYFVIHKRQFRYPPELSNLVFIKILWRLQNPPFSSCSIDPQLNEEKHKNLTMIMLLLLNLWLTSSRYSLWYFPLIIYLSLNIINLCIFFHCTLRQQRSFMWSMPETNFISVQISVHAYSSPCLSLQKCFLLITISWSKSYQSSPLLL